MFDFYTDKRSEFREVCHFASRLFLYVKDLPGHWSFRECYYDVDPVNVMVLFSSTDSSDRTLTVISIRDGAEVSFSHNISK